MHGYHLPKQIERAVAAKAAEALGLLNLMKPLAKRAGTLTKSEQAIFLDAIEKAHGLLREGTQFARDAWQDRYKEEQAAKETEAMVRKD